MLARGLEVLVKAAAKEYVEVLVATRVGMIGAANCIHSLEVFAVAFAVAAQHDHNRRARLRRSTVR